METNELPRSIERLVDEFYAFYNKESEGVFSLLTLVESNPLNATKEFFINVWEDSNHKSEWELKIKVLLEGKAVSKSFQFEEVDKEFLWEEIYYEITEPISLAFRKRKAEFMNSLATFGKMLAAAGFLAGVAYSLYTYGIRF
jgi:hypothetical protein